MSLSEILGKEESERHSIIPKKNTFVGMLTELDVMLLENKAV